MGSRQGLSIREWKLYFREAVCLCRMGTHYLMNRVLVISNGGQREVKTNALYNARDVRITPDKTRRDAAIRQLT